MNLRPTLETPGGIMPTIIHNDGTVTDATQPVPLCEHCHDAIPLGGVDFVWRHALRYEACGAADHDEIVAEIEHAHRLDVIAWAKDR